MGVFSVGRALTYLADAGYIVHSLLCFSLLIKVLALLILADNFLQILALIRSLLFWCNSSLVLSGYFLSTIAPV